MIDKQMRNTIRRVGQTQNKTMRKEERKREKKKRNNVSDFKLFIHLSKIKRARERERERGKEKETCVK